MLQLINFLQALLNMLVKIQAKISAEPAGSKQDTVSIQFSGLVQSTVNKAASKCLQEIEKVFGAVDWSKSPLKRYISLISESTVGSLKI